MTKIILKNRSLAENDPMNLLKFEACNEYFLEHGREKFIERVYLILDCDE